MLADQRGVKSQKRTQDAQHSHLPVIATLAWLLVNVPHQLKSSSPLGHVQVELNLINSRWGGTGNFLTVARRKGDWGDGCKRVKD